MSTATLGALALGVAGATLALFFVLGYEQTCHERWGASGQTYAFRGGQCLILAGRDWIPAANAVVHVQGKCPGS